ncbi:MOSC domain-containing protein [Klebsiella sp. BIGb0407]|uniref:MOSC domain-containing protein n=1 Tax=Klebsiella sp. BIGb0407 TaxID=2940603 RepID=UPI002169E307|nr:MOSC domain-containing protein [Klebsiella sp. BIGb0407]MCS3432171.1 MOSC domain-containing protein YiiM [Klebsiella sp. BIGb0407]
MNVQPQVATLDVILCHQRMADGTRQKKTADGRVYVGMHGLETADGHKEYFDDPDCAIMNYALEHYDFWRTRYAGNVQLFKTPGIFGENLATRGITENTVCIGDIFRVGSALLQLSWGRVACGTMAERLHDPDAPELMHQQSRNGWFYRVLQMGEIQAGNIITLVERPHSDWPLSRVQKIIFNPDASVGDLEALSKLNLLAAAWKNEVQARLDLM